MVSLGLMIYLAARKIPQIADTVEDASRQSGLFHKIDRILGNLPLEKADFLFSQIFEKVLRKLRLLFMKLDNQMAKHLDRFKNKQSENSESSKKLHLFEKENNGGQEFESNGQKPDSGKNKNFDL